MNNQNDLVDKVDVIFHENVALKRAKHIVTELNYSIKSDELYSALQTLEVNCPEAAFQKIESNFMKYKEVETVEKPQKFQI